jgi:hypothetical protein
MSKSSRKKKENDQQDQNLPPVIEKPIVITSAGIKDAQCNYGYEIKTGPCAGDKLPTRKGANIVHDDMHLSFRALNVHLAILDDAFKYSSIEVNSLDEVRDHEITDLFSVTGFKVHGNDENEGFVLLGEKWVTNGVFGLETPKISSGSNYPFYDELVESVEAARSEVEQYMNGKAQPKDEDQPELPFPDEDRNEFNNPE